MNSTVTIIDSTAHNTSKPAEDGQLKVGRGHATPIKPVQTAKCWRLHVTLVVCGSTDRPRPAGCCHSNLILKLVITSILPSIFRIFRICPSQVMGYCCLLGNRVGSILSDEGPVMGVAGRGPRVQVLGVATPSSCLWLRKNFTRHQIQIHCTLLRGSVQFCYYFS